MKEIHSAIKTTTGISVVLLICPTYKKAAFSLHLPLESWIQTPYS